MDKIKIFNRTIKAMDRFSWAVGKGWERIADYYLRQMRKGCDEIEALGLDAEFEEYAMLP